MEQMHELPEYEDLTTAKVLSESLSHYLDRKLSKKRVLSGHKDKIAKSRIWT